MFKRLLKCMGFGPRKPVRPHWDYQVTEKKDANGCSYYIVKVKMGAKVCLGVNYGANPKYDAEMRVSFCNEKYTTGSPVRFACPVCAESKAVEYIRQKRNLDAVKVVKEGKVNAKTSTHRC